MIRMTTLLKVSKRQSWRSGEGNGGTGSGQGGVGSIEGMRSTAAARDDLERCLDLGGGRGMVSGCALSPVN